MRVAPARSARRAAHTHAHTHTAIQTAVSPRGRAIRVVHTVTPSPTRAAPSSFSSLTYMHPPPVLSSSCPLVRPHGSFIPAAVRAHAPNPPKPNPPHPAHCPVAGRAVRPDAPRPCGPSISLTRGRARPPRADPGWPRQSPCLAIRSCSRVGRRASSARRRGAPVLSWRR